MVFPLRFRCYVAGVNEDSDEGAAVGRGIEGMSGNDVSLDIGSCAAGSECRVDRAETVSVATPAGVYEAGNPAKATELPIMLVVPVPPALAKPITLLLIV